MRIDIVTIFPDYLAPLGLSLIGRAVAAGSIALTVRDLRDWTDDPHRTVDDTPAGGGAGMVMKPDVWGRALDEMLAPALSFADAPPPTPGHPPRTVLAIPTPAGIPLTQRIVEDLAGVDHLVIACGRYEGIDARVAEHFAGRVETLEYSLGDYVLNGGEVAALALVEAVARLLPGVVGNEASLVEESHGAAGLLEYPVYTRPVSWRGLEIPEVLQGGHHALIEQWRASRALENTARRRPDLLAGLAVESISKADREMLAQLGWLVSPGGLRPLRIRKAQPEDADELAQLAADTFPFACPPNLGELDIAAFISEHLTVERFTEYLADPAGYLVMVAEVDQCDAPLVGYTMVVLPRTAEEPPYDDDVAVAVPQRPAAELSKIYVRSDLFGSGLARALLEATFSALAGFTVEGAPISVVWLGTNAGNRRAQRFYAHSGFAMVGARRFLVGGREQDDSVWARSPLESTAPPVAD